jgi:hypothetical protein
MSYLGNMRGCVKAVNDLRDSIDREQSPEALHSLAVDAGVLADKIKGSLWLPHRRQQAAELVDKANRLGQAAYDKALEREGDQ